MSASLGFIREDFPQNLVGFRFSIGWYSIFQDRSKLPYFAFNSARADGLAESDLKHAFQQLRRAQGHFRSRRCFFVLLAEARPDDFTVLPLDEPITLQRKTPRCC